MTPLQVQELVADVQRRRGESDSIEVKAARGGTPKRLYESLSAFANHTAGGVVLFGLDESGDFSVSGVGNAQRLQEEVAHLASSEMEPALRPNFAAYEIGGETVIALEIEELPPTHKPCFYRPAGLPKGAYVRVGNTNRQMTDYEVFGYLSGRGQPAHDEELVADATLDDLDRSLVDGYLERLRRTRPRSGYLDGPIEDVLVQLHVCRRDGDACRPTLAGLLTCGKFPQQFLPQLMITFVQYYGTTEEEKTPRGERFLDNQRFEGPIPEMITRAEDYVMAAMRKSSLIQGVFRRDVPEYPREALREALANAVAHRDYSSYVCGSYIRIRMFADRLEVQSPGGLHGNVTVDNLEDEHSTRNARLMRMMEDMQVVENRGSGIKSMLQALRDANLEPPKFADRRASFLVTFRNHTLLNPEAIVWLNQFADRSLNDRQRLALVYSRQQGQISNPDYRRLNRVDPLVAGRELRGLVELDLLDQEGAGRWTCYRLAVPAGPPDRGEPKNDEDRILTHVRTHGSITNAECRKLIGADGDRAYYLLRGLCEQNKLVPHGVGKGRRYEAP